jgi:hypothetical protein
MGPKKEAKKDKKDAESPECESNSNVFTLKIFFKLAQGNLFCFVNVGSMQVSSRVHSMLKSTVLHVNV